MPWQAQKACAALEKEAKQANQVGRFMALFSKLPELNKYLNSNPASIKTLMLQISLFSSLVYLLFCKKHR